MVSVLQGDREATQELLNYKEWFEKRSEIEKIDILGLSRYKEYKNGNPVTFFVKGDKKLTLQELGIDRIDRTSLFEKIKDNIKLKKRNKIVSNTTKVLSKTQMENYIKSGKELTDTEKLEFKNYIMSNLKDNFPK